MNNIKTILLATTCAIAGFVAGKASNQDEVINKSYWLSGAQFTYIRLHQEYEKNPSKIFNQQDVMRWAINYYNDRDYFKSDDLMKAGWNPPVKDFIHNKRSQP